MLDRTGEGLLVKHTATVFVSYSHADKRLARAVAGGLTALGYRVWIDEGELRAGDSIIQAIADAIGRVDFVVAFVSPASVGSAWCQKELALAMTEEINQVGVTVLPVRIDSVAMPASLIDKLYVDATALASDELVQRLDRDMRGHLEPADPLPPRRRAAVPPRTKTIPSPPAAGSTAVPWTEIRIIGVDANGITAPRNDGTRGSALYQVPIQLSQRPDPTWTQMVVHHWDRPTRFTTMHRPGIGRVSGDRFVLDGTTIDEVVQYHLATLEEAVEQANAEYRQHVARQQAEQNRKAQAAAEHDAAVQAGLERLRGRFDS